MICKSQGYPILLKVEIGYLSLDTHMMMCWLKTTKCAENQSQSRILLDTIIIMIIIAKDTVVKSIKMLGLGKLGGLQSRQRGREGR